MIDLSQSRTAWPLSMLARRALWQYGLQPLVRWLPKSLSPLRVVALRIMGARIGPACLILPGVRVLMPWNLELADHVAIGEGVNIYNFAKITIGRMTVVSQFTYLCTGSHDHERIDMPLTFAPISIGEQSWLAADVFVAPGVTIADGAVVGARSVVTRSLPDSWTVYAGHPCRRIKARAQPRKVPVRPQGQT
jgi:putative colanic acid biosynthesis acetyltransferase WcaF